MTGFIHYFYSPVPKGFVKDQHLMQFTSYLKANYDGVVDVQIQMKESIWGYNNNIKTPFFKIYVNNNRNITRLRGAFEKQRYGLKICFLFSRV